MTPAMSQIAERVGWTLPTDKLRDWRPINPPVQGHVNGLQDTLAGQLVATDGVLAILHRADGRHFEVHIHWFVKWDLDAEEDDSDNSETDTEGDKAVRSAVVAKCQRQPRRSAFDIAKELI